MLFQNPLPGLREGLAKICNRMLSSSECDRVILIVSRPAVCQPPSAATHFDRAVEIPGTSVENEGRRGCERLAIFIWKKTKGEHAKQRNSDTVVDSSGSHLIENQNIRVHGSRRRVVALRVTPLDVHGVDHRKLLNARKGIQAAEICAFFLGTNAHRTFLVPLFGTCELQNGDHGGEGGDWTQCTAPGLWRWNLIHWLNCASFRDVGRVARHRHTPRSARDNDGKQCRPNNLAGAHVCESGPNDTVSLGSLEADQSCFGAREAYTFTIPAHVSSICGSSASKAFDSANFRAASIASNVFQALLWRRAVPVPSQRPKM